MTKANTNKKVTKFVSAYDCYILATVLVRYIEVSNVYVTPAFILDWLQELGDIAAKIAEEKKSYLTEEQAMIWSDKIDELISEYEESEEFQSSARKELNV